MRVRPSFELLHPIGRNIRGSWLVVCALVAAVGCRGPDGPPGPPGDPGTTGESCTVADNGDGTITITCGDVDVIVANGDAASCTVTANPDGTNTIMCSDGTQATISGGTDGMSCTAVDNGDGTVTIYCEDGTQVIVSNGSPGTPAPIDTALEAWEDLPGLDLEILTVTGATGADGTFQPGDTLVVTFALALSDGRPITLDQLDALAIWFAGPTYNYQHVIPTAADAFYLTDVITTATDNLDGTFTYAFTTPIPAVYSPPLFDTTKFSDGELTGLPLDPGTYTVALRLYKNYSVEGTSYRDTAWNTFEVLVAGATTIEEREFVTTENCNQCHEELQFHGGTYRSTKLCVTCHTSGAEDRFSTDTGDATPVTTDFRVLIHRLHNGAHLPSVNGVGTNTDGTRNYAATPVPYMVGGVTAFDFSAVGFPVWPNLSVPMPRDSGYTALSTADKAKDDTLRRGVTACEKCHGDPDGAGPLPAPAQGGLVYDLTETEWTASRRACGSCHDDVDWSLPYLQNAVAPMLPQADDSTCVLCHLATGPSAGGSVVDGHLHPIYRSAFNAGLNIGITSVAEAGTNDGDGTIDPGEKIAVTFSMTDDAGTALDQSALGGVLSVVIAGPNYNRNVIDYFSIPRGALTGTAPFTLNAPVPMFLEYVGDSTATTGDVFTAANAPIWNFLDGTSTSFQPAVYARTATGATTTLAAAAPALDNYIDVASATGIVNGDYVVIDDGTVSVEYMRVQRVVGTRLWFASIYQLTLSGASAYKPYLRNAHAAGATLSVVTLTTLAAANYTVDSTAGTITEVSEFGAGYPVVVSYVTDFVMPSVYGPPLNDSPDLDESWGKWKGLPIVDGTYAIGVWGRRVLCMSPTGASLASTACTSGQPDYSANNTSYSGTSVGYPADFLVAAATTIEPYAKISSTDNCIACHDDMFFHGGGRRGPGTCLMCHATAGMEDWPEYRSPFPTVATTGVTPNFRTMLHKIHTGEELAYADTYTILGNSASINTFGEVGFPAMPEGVKDCNKCHGTATVWYEPDDRTHPGGTVEARVYGATCGSCHDSSSAAAHIEINTSLSGLESCTVCHGEDRDFEVPLVHKVR